MTRVTRTSISNPIPTDRHSRDTAAEVGPFRIGIMLRGIDEVDGPGVYIRNLCDALFEIDSINEYVVFYSHQESADRYLAYPNVTERVVRGVGKLIWDQVAIPFNAAREQLDVLFHHKFTVPFLCTCPTVVQQRGAEYWTFPEWYDAIERLYAKIAIPLYCRQADRVLTNSDTLALELARYVNIEPQAMQTVYAAADPQFQPVIDPGELNRVRHKYGLPVDDFYLMVAKGYSSTASKRGEIYPRKNVSGTLQAYRLVRDRASHVPSLVVAGPGFEHIGERIDGQASNDSSGVYYPGFVEFADMPAIYSLAAALVFPSYSESFGIPLVEAMACGTPVIASKTAACPEIVGNAGLLVDPNVPDSIADAMFALSTDHELRTRLSRMGRSRSQDFSWRESAMKLLKVLEDVASRLKNGSDT